MEAARIHVQWCPESKITKHYEKIKRKRGDKIAIIAAARKLLQAIYYMLKNKEPFRNEGYCCRLWGAVVRHEDRDNLIKAQSYPRTESAIVRPKTADRCMSCPG